MKKISLLKRIFFLLIGFFSFVASVFAEDYVVISKDGKVFDDASPKYVTLNEKNEEVMLIPGMVFKTTEHLPGWYLIEYSPGLRGYIQDQIVASNIKSPEPGTYNLKNSPDKKINIEKSGKNWKASYNGKNYSGSQFENIIIFNNESGNPAFSLVNLENGVVVISYDNALTKFF